MFSAARRLRLMVRSVACNPPLAHLVLLAESPIELLLPCNVVVTEDDEGNVIVSAFDPIRMSLLIDRDDVQPITDDVKARMERVLAAVGEG
ncbi:DUF302 domain-containing protein [Lujinxingia sediminis]|nr:DUF302 domain-containing protein [Lujinxingia sediminis]